MTTLTSLARARAAERGRAQPLCTVRHCHLSDRPLVFVPLMMAGEACAPLAAMTGDDPSRPGLLVVAQPRNRDQRFTFAAGLAAIVLRYIERFTTETHSVPGREPRIRCASAPQILVPNPAGITFTRRLGRSTRFRRTDGPYPVAPPVPLLGRWLTFFTDQTDVPGSSLMLTATGALGQHWASGQSPAEDLNLASLLGWIDPPPGLTGRDAALAAEDPLHSPPAGPATDPSFDNEVLSPLMAACDRAARDGDQRAQRHARSALEQAVAGQLSPTWRLMWRSIELLRGLPAGAHVARRWDADKDAFTGHLEHLRESGPPQPRRDSAVSAARRLARLERLQAGYSAQCAFDDPLVMAEHRLTGEAFAGHVTACDRTRQDTTGKRRKLRPRLTVTTLDPIFPTRDAVLVSPSRPGQEARVLSVTAVPGGTAEVEVELSGGMGRSLTPAPGSVPEMGEHVCYATFRDEYQPPPAFPAVEDTPWTHGGPPEPYVPADDDAREAWS